MFGLVDQLPAQLLLEHVEVVSDDCLVLKSRPVCHHQPSEVQVTELHADGHLVIAHAQHADIEPLLSAPLDPAVDDIPPWPEEVVD
jgi:hypothetical protein